MHIISVLIIKYMSANPKPSASPVLIAGGGIGDLAAAYVLACNSHAVTVLEQAPQFGEIGAGIQRDPNIYKMFEHLGLTEKIKEVAHFPPGMGMRNEMFQSGAESACFAGLKWMYDGIDPDTMFT
jgi:protoporphyrinogen oxidase